MPAKIINKSSKSESAPLSWDNISAIIEKAEGTITKSSIDELLIRPILEQSLSKSSKHKYFTSATILEDTNQNIKNVVGNAWDSEKDGYLVIEINNPEDNCTLILNYNWIYIG